jgi:hypothetical protein
MSRGYGRGSGGPRQGMGGPGLCKCLNCWYTIPHTRGTPCATMSCPKCGSRLAGIY